MSDSITAINNGPLKLDAESATMSQTGTTVPHDTPAFLCRCGQSANKPFCDGSHKKSGFTSERESTEDGVQDYAGERVRIQFNRSICSGAARCVKGLPNVFSSESSDNWIFPDAADSAEIRKAVEACPSGALAMFEGDDLIPPERHDTPSIDIISDGPYLIEAIELSEADWHTNANPDKYALCRCGLSKNKPFCDYSHAEQGWKESEQQA